MFNCQFTTHFDSFKKDGSLVMGRAEGAYVYDLSGKRYLDGIGVPACVGAATRAAAELLGRRRDDGC